MDGLNKGKVNANGQNSQVGEAASQLLNESKKLANELYQDGLQKFGEAEKGLEAYSDDLLNNVRKNPMKAILIAGGVGFLLSLLLKK